MDRLFTKLSDAPQSFIPHAFPFAYPASPGSRTNDIALTIAGIILRGLFRSRPTESIRGFSPPGRAQYGSQPFPPV